MGFATFSGPIRVGDVRYTTGTTAGTEDNTGCVIAAQVDSLTAAQVAGLTGSLGFLPAGALVTSVQFLTTTLFASTTTLQVLIAGVAVASASTITTAGTIVVAPAGTFTPTQANVGATDAAITFVATGSSSTGAVTVVIAYIVRAADGATAPTTFQN